MQIVQAKQKCRYLRDARIGEGPYLRGTTVYDSDNWQETKNHYDLGNQVSNLHEVYLQVPNLSSTDQ